MSAEISTSVSLSVSKGGASVSTSTSKALDLTGTDMITSTNHTSNTTTTLVNIGSIAQIQVITFKNLSTTTAEIIDITTDAAHTVFLDKLPAGASSIHFGLPSTTVYIQAQSGTPDLVVTAVET